MPKKEAVPLSVMAESGELFTVGKKKYRIRPLKLREVQEFKEDNINVGPQFVTFLTEEGKEKVDKWIQRCITDENGKPKKLEDLTNEDWDLVQLREAILKICDLSG